MAEVNIINEPGKRELIVVRTFDAPVSLVWEAWTNPEHLINWWGPKGFTNTFYEINIKPGGVWRFMMHGSDGVDYPNRIIFSEVVKYEKLSYAHDSDKENDTDLFEVNVLFEKQEQQTKLTMTMRFASAEVRDKIVKAAGAIEGAKQTTDRLEEQLKKMSALNN